jgi:adenine-specific DNA-methyltransferase
LAERLVLALTNPGDTVLDPYMGTGTAILAALRNGRKALGCDNVGRYVDIAKRRIEEMRAGKLKVRALNKPLYKPPEWPAC